MIKKPKLLILYNKVWPYRLCIFNELAESFDLTVSVTTKGYLDKDYNFNVIYTPTKRVGPFEWHTDNLSAIFEQYDCIIGLYDVRLLKFMLLTLFSKKPILLWGIGVTASYENHFDSKQTWDRVRLFFAKSSSGVLLYSDYPVQRHLSLGLKENKIWVAHNTTDVDYEQTAHLSTKNKILFVGSLYKEKRIIELVSAYKDALSSFPNLPDFDIVGDGDDYSALVEFVENNNLCGKVNLHGSVYDNAILKNLFSTSLICLSPNQAGLSVLKSMGFGVPFATNSDSITGGEIFNISHMVNGVLIDKITKDMSVFFSWIANNKEKLISMGVEARKHYFQNRTPLATTQIIKEAVESSIRRKSK